MEGEEEAGWVAGALAVLAQSFPLSTSTSTSHTLFSLFCGRGLLRQGSSTVGVGGSVRGSSSLLFELALDFGSESRVAVKLLPFFFSTSQTHLLVEQSHRKQWRE